MNTTVALRKEGSLLGATLLITGCSIGVGMIGLPVISAMTGFMPAMVAMFFCYLFATGTGLLILEATLWFQERVNLISIAAFALGKAGMAFTWTLFLFLFYCLFVAYIDGGGQLFTHMFSLLLHQSIAREIGILSCVLFTALIVYGGTKIVSYVSRLFLFGLFFSFALLLSLGLPHIEGTKLLYTNWKSFHKILPIILICFGYQNLIPTLIYYTKRNITTLRAAIFLGNLLPFSIYFIWNFVILGILPEGNSLALAAIISKNDMVTGLLESASQSDSVLLFANIFAFFAILTPFMTNMLAFVDFLKDGLRLSKISYYEPLVYLLVLFPPTLITMLFPHLFLKALSIAGGFADVLLFGILPVCIVWIGRYVKKIEGPFRAPGGKFFLTIILLFSITILWINLS